MATATQPQSASSHYALAALVAQRAATEARKAKPSGLIAVARVINRHQMTQAVLSERAVAEMLLEQEIDSAADALLNSLEFTTEIRMLEGMLDSAGDQGFDRLAASLVQDAGRAAESVAAAVRPDVYHVRYVTPPCCKRCAVLTGRVYRWSEGFLRHPNCDCVMIPTAVAAPFAQTPDGLVEQGLVSDLSKVETKALADGADLGQIVNAQRTSAGMREAGRVLARADRLTPEGIYRRAGEDRDEAVRLLRLYRYIT